MEITLGLLADAANLSQEGKLNVLGAFTNINASGFPARHPQMQLVVEIQASPGEVGATKHFEVKLIDEDGTELGGTGGDFTVPQPQQAGQRVRMGVVIPLVDVVFNRAGNHVFDVLIDGDSKRQIPLTVLLIEGSQQADDN